jgi:hypothetical protein
MLRRRCAATTRYPPPVPPFQSPQNPARRALRVLAPALLWLLALWLLNFSLYSYWAGSAPPGPATPSWQRQGNIYCGISTSLFILGALSIWGLRPIMPSRDAPGEPH